MNKKILLAFLIAQTFIISPNVQADEPDEVAFSPLYMGKGSSTLHGQAFMRQKGGGVVTCAGSSVYLVPNTPYYRRKQIEALGSNNYVTEGKFKDAVRETNCDARGSFTFRDLPNGNELGWNLITKVEWYVADKAQGGVLIESFIKLKEGSETEIIVTR